MAAPAVRRSTRAWTSHIAAVAVAVLLAAGAAAATGVAAGDASPETTTRPKGQPPKCGSDCLACRWNRGPLKNAGPSAKRRLLTTPWSSVCTVCQANMVPSANQKKCICAAGTAPDGTGQCKPCPAGQVAAKGSASCKACGGSLVPNADASACVTPSNVVSIPPCDYHTICPTKQVCGTYTTCDKTLLCGTCPADHECAADGLSCVPSSPAKPNCTPAKTCPRDRACGFAPDGCGDTIPCGDPSLAGKCPAGSICNADGTECLTIPPPPTPCQPTTTCSPGIICGTEPDGCGGEISCSIMPKGACPIGKSCTVGGRGCIDDCVPKTTCDPAFVCGTQPNGCGGQVACGDCGAGFKCEVSATGDSSSCKSTTPPPPAPCVPATTCPGGQKCGEALDAVCGVTISCGSCPVGTACAPNGTACVKEEPQCVPYTSCPGGSQAPECGSVDDSCGGQVFCGTCPTGKTCQGNKCVAPPVTPPPPCVPDKSKVCFGRACGTVDDGCGNGGTLSCGDCPVGNTCSGTGQCFQPQLPCTPLPACSVSECGSEPNGCGASVFCGACSSDKVCQSGKCIPKPCVPVNGDCKTNADCCFSSTDTMCEAGKCKVQSGRRCQNSGKCGGCFHDCGGKTADKPCQLYGLTPGSKCSHNAAGGGGNECAGTDVCCVINKPDIPTQNGHCFGTWPPA